MIYRENNNLLDLLLNNDTNNNIILKENSFNNIDMIPLINLQDDYIIKYKDLEYIKENENIEYDDIMNIIKEEYNLNNKDLKVAINQSDYIINLDEMEELNEILSYVNKKNNDYLISEYDNNIEKEDNILIIPISENNIIYQLCETCIDSYLKTNNEYYLDMLLDEDKLEETVNKINKNALINKKRPNQAKNVFIAKRTNHSYHEYYDNSLPLYNIFTNDFSLLNEKIDDQFIRDFHDFSGKDAQKKMKQRIVKAAKQIIEKNRKGIADKISSLQRLGNRLKEKELKTSDIQQKSKIQYAFDKVKSTAKKLLDKITPSFIKDFI